eukprot:7226136-Alexandrium_andersonii.AAC.1
MPGSRGAPAAPRRDLDHSVDQQGVGPWASVTPRDHHRPPWPQRRRAKRSPSRARGWGGASERRRAARIATLRAETVE